MEETTSPEQPYAVRHCPSCGAVSDGSPHSCPSCGHMSVAGDGAFDIGKWVSAGWALFLRDIAMSVAILLVVIAPIVCLCVVGYLGVIVMAIPGEPQSGVPRVVSTVMGAVLGAVVLIAGLVVPALQAGVSSCFLNGIRTGRLKADSLWAGFRHWWACTWVCGLLTGGTILCLPLGFLLVGIPLLLGLNTLYWISLFRIVDKGRGGMEALSFAYRVLRRRLWSMLVYSLLVFSLMTVGVMAMYIGVLISVPLGYGILAASYDSLSKEQEPTP